MGSLCRDDCTSFLLTGFFCEEWGLFEPTGPCQAGYYCIAGTLPGWRGCILQRKALQQHSVHMHRLGQQTELWISLLFKVSTFQTLMVISVLEWEEPVRRGATVPRAPVCHCPAPGGPTQTGWGGYSNTHFRGSVHK